ncbi:MAG: hypothetical protein LBI84_08335 [Propionibacteriaceae bacterium]|jgi:tight adherence protein B|nr:hypothetical protein [Propionibacteriaceae bacterium]
MTALAVLAAGLAAWGLAGPASPVLLRRLTVRPSVPTARRGKRRWLAPAAVAAVVAGLGSAVGAWVLALGLAGGVVVYLGSRRRAEARALATSRETARACRVIDSLLSQGHVPSRALILAARDCPILAPAAATAQMGGEVVSLLRDIGGQPGAAGFLEVARAWEVTERTGAPLHGVLSRVKTSLAAQAELTSVIDQELAAPRATSQLLAVLPIAGLGIGYLVGGDPIDFLTATAPGRVCLMAGFGLACLGAVWSDRLAAKVSALSPAAAQRQADAGDKGSRADRRLAGTGTLTADAGQKSQRAAAFGSDEADACGFAAQASVWAAAPFAVPEPAVGAPRQEDLS